MSFGRNSNIFLKVDRSHPSPNLDLIPSVDNSIIGSDVLTNWLTLPLHVSWVVFNRLTNFWIAMIRSKFEEDWDVLVPSLSK
jgi:hypothetical protein